MADAKAAKKNAKAISDGIKPLSDKPKVVGFPGAEAKALN